MSTVFNKIIASVIIAVYSLLGDSFKAFSQNEILMEKDGGIYKIPCKVNGLRLKFIFDTGATDVCISESIALMMLENDYLSDSDIVGTSQAMVADGRIVDNTKIILKKIEIGNKTLNNVKAVVIHNQSAPLLLGQSAIEKLGKYTISGNKLIFGNQTKLSKKNGAKKAPENDTIYYDIDWKGVPNREFAQFYRIVSNESDPNYTKKFRDYYITGELQGEGEYISIDKYDDQKTVFNNQNISYYKSGQIKSKGTFKDGILNGEYTTYYENGLIKTHCFYENGLEEGIFTGFLDDYTECFQIECHEGKPK